jgi:hypothetical protein
MTNNGNSRNHLADGNTDRVHIIADMENVHDLGNLFTAHR